MEHLRQMVARYAYEQFPGQLSPSEAIGRSLVLFEDKAAFGLPSASEWKAAFGASVRDLVNVGFVAFSSAMSNRGRVLLDPLRESRIDGLFEDLNFDAASAVLDSFYCGSVAKASLLARQLEQPTYEKWSPSPLLETPVIELDDGERLAPWPRLILDRFSPGGLYYPAIGAFGTAFSDALGPAFESYVGDQLNLLTDAVVTGERKYVEGKDEKLTCDWIVVTDECVLLVEVKATRPVLQVRIGAPDGFSDVDKKIGRAADQLEATATLIRTGHPVVADVPSNLPTLGMIVTLEPFHLMDAFLYQDLLDGRSLPIAVSYSQSLEIAVATLGSRADTGLRLLNAFTKGPSALGPVPRLERAISELEPMENPILKSAWSRIVK